MPSLFRAIVAIVVFASAYFVDTTPLKAQEFAIAAQAGTTGLGGGAIVGLTSRVNLRASYGFIPGDPYSFTINDIDFALGFPSYLLTTVDLYPFGGFHLSAGGLLITNDGDLDVVGSFEGKSLVIGSTTFTGTAADRFNGSFSLKRFQPYVGVGIGNPLGKRLSVNFDAGVGFGETPTVALVSVGQVPQAELDQEVAEIEADIPDWLKYYPVLSLSVSIGF